MMANTGKRSCCQNAGGVWKDNGCNAPGSQTGLEGYDSAAYNACLAELEIK